MSGERNGKASTEELRQQLDEFRDDFEALRAEVGKVIVGQEEIVDGTLTALIAGGHVLLEGVPGLGKTLLVRTLADALHLKFQRIQFTPDLMPADLIGTNVVLETPEGGRKFEFQPGPVFANLVLADEINRATPKTQSALLEAMQEQSVTVAGKTYHAGAAVLRAGHAEPARDGGDLPAPRGPARPVLLQAPGQVPERRRDRGDPRPDDRGGTTPGPSRSSTASGSSSCRGWPGRSRSPTSSAATGSRWSWPRTPRTSYATEMARQYVRYGSSPRGAQAIILAAKIRAILDHRYHVSREDIRAVAHPALRHRLILNFEGQAEDVRPTTIIDDILEHGRGSRLALIGPSAVR